MCLVWNQQLFFWLGLVQVWDKRNLLVSLVGDAAEHRHELIIISTFLVFTSAAFSWEAQKSMWSSGGFGWWV